MTPPSTPTIVVTAASLHPDAVAMLAGFHLCHADVRATEAELAALCAQVRPVALLVRYGQISARVIRAAGPTLRVIAKHGVGTDNIDRQAATEAGIPVLAALGSNSQAVAEHTIALMLACARQVPWLDTRMRQGHWDKDEYAGLELEGATLGLVGAGAIGRRVGRIAAAIGMQLLVHDPHAPDELLPAGARRAGLESLLGQSDVVSLHCPLTPDTHHLLDARRLGLLPRGAIVINTARAELIDDTALRAALEAGHLRAGLDCHRHEPVPANEPLLQAPHLVVTPHIGGTTTAAFRAMGVGAARHILDTLRSD